MPWIERKKSVGSKSLPAALVMRRLHDRQQAPQGICLLSTVDRWEEPGCYVARRASAYTGVGSSAGPAGVEQGGVGRDPRAQPGGATRARVR